MSTIAERAWLPYLHARPTAQVIRFAPPPDAVSAETSMAAREPNLFPLHEQLNRIGLLQRNWDGYGSARPDQTAIESTRQLIEGAYRSIAPLIGWQNPHASASEDGEIVLEWSHGIKRLTIYVGPHQSTYVKSWGPHLVNEMEDGPLPDDWVVSLWAWLFVG